MAAIFFGCEETESKSSALLMKDHDSYVEEGMQLPTSKMWKIICSASLALPTLYPEERGGKGSPKLLWWNAISG